MIRGLLVTHGHLGEALTDVVEHLLGPQDGLTTLSNEGLSASEIRRRIDGVVAALPEGDELILFSDLVGGSCEAACRVVARSDPRCRGISGLNLPMLLEFCHYRVRLGAGDLMDRVLLKGRNGVRLCDDGGQ